MLFHLALHCGKALSAAYRIYNTSNRCENFLSECNLRQNTIVILHLVRLCAMSVAKKIERMRHHKIVLWNFENDKL